MNIDDWRYYNHAAIPAVPPNHTPDLSPINNGTIWQIQDGKPLFARYTTDWDCGYDTGWWYVIKDTPLDRASLKKKCRYEINKAQKNFIVRQLDPWAYQEELFQVELAAFSAYPARFRPKFTKKKFWAALQAWQPQITAGKLVLLGAFYKETNELAGFNYVVTQERSINFYVQKTKPYMEKYGVNAALVNGLLEYFATALANNYYICDGSRSINHVTNFQNYLEKYFQFRKAYCKLNIVYKKPYGLIIKILFPFRNILMFLGNRIKIFHQISAILKMEEIVRNSKD